MILRQFSLVALVAAFPSFSQALTLECAMQVNAASGGYVTETYVLQHDEATGKAVASDALILHFHDAPIAAKLVDDTAKKLVLSWTVQMTNGTGQMTKMLFRASYFKARKEITVRATPTGYANDFEARGTCRSL